MLEIYLKFTFCLFAQLMGDEDLYLFLPTCMPFWRPRRMFFLSAVNTQIQGLQSNLLKAQTDLASQIASEVQPETYVFKKKGNEQRFNFNRKVIKRSSAAVR